MCLRLYAGDPTELLHAFAALNRARLGFGATKMAHTGRHVRCGARARSDAVYPKLWERIAPCFIVQPSSVTVERAFSRLKRMMAHSRPSSAGAFFTQETLWLVSAADGTILELAREEWDVPPLTDEAEEGAAIGGGALLPPSATYCDE